MSPNDVARVQQYLRKLFGCDRIFIDPPKRIGQSAEFRVADEFLGTIHRDAEDGEVSFALTMQILEEDLPAAGEVSVNPTKR
jgi:hypothetical protein